MPPVAPPGVASQEPFFPPRFAMLIGSKPMAAVERQVTRWEDDFFHSLLGFVSLAWQPLACHPVSRHGWLCSLLEAFRRFRKCSVMPQARGRSSCLKTRKHLPFLLEGKVVSYGTWWIHYTVHFDTRKRRIRRSLKTRHLAEAWQRRDHFLTRLARDGEVVSNLCRPRLSARKALRPAESAPAVTLADGPIGCRHTSLSRMPQATETLRLSTTDVPGI